MDIELLKEELKQLFHILKSNEYYIYELKELNPEYGAYFISEGNWKGVAIQVPMEIAPQEFLANFESIRVCIQNKIVTQDKKICLLSLLAKDIDLVDKFILLCIDFIDPGENGENRNELINNPQKWVNKWKKLLGNTFKNDMDYSYLGELVILYYLLNENKEVKLTNQGSYDLETKEKNYEVKTTIMKYASIIEVHSQYQLKRIDNIPLELYFVRLEESSQGISINKILKLLNSKNYEMDKIMDKIKDISSESREKNYKILEIRKYNIDDTFPRITAKSFKNDVIPKNIINIKYVIDLDGINYEKINLEEVK